MVLLLDCSASKNQPLNFGSSLVYRPVIVTADGISLGPGRHDGERHEGSNSQLQGLRQGVLSATFFDRRFLSFPSFFCWGGGEFFFRLLEIFIFGDLGTFTTVIYQGVGLYIEFELIAGTMYPVFVGSHCCNVFLGR